MGQLKICRWVGVWWRTCRGLGGLLLVRSYLDKTDLVVKNAMKNSINGL